MKIITELKGLGFRSPVSAAVGFFDGFHRGHQEVASGALAAARDNGYESCAVTFEAYGEKLLTTQDEKLALIKNAGFDCAVVLRSGEGWVRWSPERFVEGFLISELKARSVSVGPDFRFGKDRTGDINTLMGFSRRITVSVADLVFHGNEKISSTAIREAVRRGELDEAETMLGRPYFFTGETVRGSGTGRKIGFPTVNFSVPAGKLLPEGVFACELIFDQAAPPSGVYGACFIGTIDVGGLSPQKTSVEVHILNYQTGMEDTVKGARLLHKTRGAESFKSLDDLKARLASDIEKIQFDIQNSYY